MKKNTTKNIMDILENSGLNRIVQRANQLQTLHLKIQQLLPTQYQKLYRTVNLYDNLLIIDVPNAVIRQGLLMQQSHLLKLVQVDFPAVNRLEININPDFKPIN